MAGDGLGVLEDLGSERVLVLRHVCQLFEQRQVAVRLDVAHRARVAIPIPRASEVACLLDDPDALVARLAQLGAHQQTAEAAADDGDVHLVEERLSLDTFGVWVVDVVGEVADHFDVLLVAVVAQPLVAFGPVTIAQLVGIEVDIGQECLFQRRRFACRGAGSHWGRAHGAAAHASLAPVSCAAGASGNI